MKTSFQQATSAGKERKQTSQLVSITNVCDECMNYVQRNVNTLNVTNFL